MDSPPTELSTSILNYLNELPLNSSASFNLSSSLDELNVSGMPACDENKSPSNSTHQQIETENGLHKSPVLDSTEKTKQLLQEGRYVEAIVYDIHGTHHLFKGMVDKMYPGEVSVRFMKCLGADVYVWPTVDDISLVPVYDICKVLSPPCLVARGRYKFD